MPQFRFKQDTVPGREIAGWFQVKEAGKYEAPCAELCGFGHSGMKAWVYAHAAGDYDKWAAENLKAEAAPPSQTRTAAADTAGAAASPAQTEGKAKP